MPNAPSSLAAGWRCGMSSTPVPSGGASDASIKDVEPNDLAALVNRLGVQAIFCNGATSGRLYRKYAQPLTGLEAVVLPSTSPANAAFTMPRLLDAWGTALEGYVNKP